MVWGLKKKRKKEKHFSKYICIEGLEIQRFSRIQVDLFITTLHIYRKQNVNLNQLYFKAKNVFLLREYVHDSSGGLNLNHLELNLNTQKVDLDKFPKQHLLMLG